MSALYHASMYFQDEGFLRYLVRVMVENIFPPSEHEMVVRKMTRDEVARLMAPESVTLHGVSGLGGSLTVTALLPYRALLVQALILEAKFEHNRRAHALLGSVLSDYIKVSLQNSQNIVLVPLPLGIKRQKERGYNQVGEIARYAAYHLRVGVEALRVEVRPEILVRIRETVPQTSLGREARLLNIRGAFGAASSPSHVLNSSDIYVLIDDVVTTGATLSAAYEALIKAGAKHIVILALAH
jgi:predicted amidophosphoribosyltransferase